jgi:hypothetical protein
MRMGAGDITCDLHAEQEVETTKASEFEGLNKELEASKQRCAALQSSNKGVVAQLARLQTAVHALARDYKSHRTTSRTQLAELGQSIVAQYKPMFVGKLKVCFVVGGVTCFPGGSFASRRCGPVSASDLTSVCFCYTAGSGR